MKVIYLFLNHDDIGYRIKIAPGDGGFFMEPAGGWGIWDYGVMINAVQLNDILNRAARGRRFRYVWRAL